MLGLHLREIGFGSLPRHRGVLLRIARDRELTAELIHFRLERRIRQQPLRAGGELRVLFLELVARALRRRELPRELIAGIDRRRMLRLDFRRDLLASRDVALEPHIHRIHLPAQPVALDDERADLPLERSPLPAQLRGDFPALGGDRLAFAAELRLLLRVLRLECVELPAQRGHVATRIAATVDRALEFADLGILRLRLLLERDDARRGFRNPLFRIRKLLLRLREFRHPRDGLLRGIILGLLQVRTRGVALLHDLLQADAVLAEFRLHPLHRLCEKCGCRLLGIHASPEQRLDFRRTLARRLELGLRDPVLRLERLHLVLQILHRLAHVGLAQLQAPLDFLPHLQLGGLHVGRRLLLPLVRGREEFLHLRPRILLAREFQRRLLLRLLEGLDPAVQLLHHAVVIPRARHPCARVAGFSGGFKKCELILQPIDLLLLGLQFLVCATREVRADGHRRAAFRDAVHRIIEIPAQRLGLRGGLFVRLAERRALPLQIHDLPLVFAAHRRDTALHVQRHLVELEVNLRSRRLFGTRRRRRRGFFPGEPQRSRRRLPAVRRGSRRCCGTRAGGLGRRERLRLVRAGTREPRSCLLSAAASRQHAGRRSGSLPAGAGLRWFFRTQLLGECRGRAAIRAGRRTTLRTRHELCDLLPRETNLDAIRLQHLGAENLRNPAVDLRQVHHRDPLRDPRRERRDLEAQFGLQIMRPGQEELRRDAVEEIAEFQPDAVRRHRSLRLDEFAHAGLASALHPTSRRLLLLRAGCGLGLRLWLALETVEETHA